VTCCCTYKCEQGRDCPVRQASIQAVNKAYIERGRDVDSNPYLDTVGTFKALIIVLAVCIAVTLIFFIWGK